MVKKLWENLIERIAKRDVINYLTERYVKIFAEVVGDDLGNRKRIIFKKPAFAIKPMQIDRWTNDDGDLIYTAAKIQSNGAMVADNASFTFDIEILVLESDTYVVKYDTLYTIQFDHARDSSPSKVDITPVKGEDLCLDISKEYTR